MIQLGPVQLTDDSEKVTDPDEEIFLLYTALQAHPISEEAHRGLGYLDSHHDTIEVVIEFDDEDASNGTVGSPASSGPSTPASRTPPSTLTKRPLNSRTHSGGKHRSSRHAHTRKTVKPWGPQSVQVELYQDKTRLHTTKGDTGSVLWRASIDFARMILRQFHHRSRESFFERESLSELRVLELGAGTGLLPVLLAPLVKHYTATDIAGLTHLISKNVHLNAADHDLSNVVVDTLDWEQLHCTSVSRRRKAFPDDAPDLILAVDCIYHPSLVGPLVSTINHFASPDKTTVVVVSELRAEDVLRGFLEAWLGSNGTRWEIWHAGDGTDGPGLLGVPYVTWVGRKVSVPKV
ncbi:putative methyltransferase-domain-containing protein [Schizophyllum commune]